MNQNVNIARKLVAVARLLLGSDNSNVFYHVSPYKFSSFSLSHVGTGMGTGFWGYGIYLCEEKTTAEAFAKMMLKADKKELYIYEVECSGNLVHEQDAVGDSELTAGELYAKLVEESDEKHASESMKEDYGIDGLKYWSHEDGNSVVIFNVSTLRIVKVESFSDEKN